eukprot:3393732-Amphidinium_carterae.1
MCPHKVDTHCVSAVGSLACKLTVAALRGFCKVGVSNAIVRHTTATQTQQCVLLLSQSGCSQKLPAPGKANHALDNANNRRGWQTK